MRGSHSLCQRGFVCLGLITAVALLAGGCPSAGLGDLLGNRGGSIVGRWNVTGTLATNTEVDYGPTAGNAIMSDVWTITDKGNGTYALVSQNNGASLSGTAYQNGAAFEIQVPYEGLNNLYRVYHIEVFPGSRGIIATEEITDIGTNPLSGGTPTGRTQTEAWAIEGTAA